MSVIFRYNYAPKAGQHIQIRKAFHGPYTKWFRVIIDDVLDDGYFFASK